MDGVVDLKLVTRLLWKYFSHISHISHIMRRSLRFIRNQALAEGNNDVPPARSGSSCQATYYSRRTTVQSLAPTTSSLSLKFSSGTALGETPDCPRLAPATINKLMLGRAVSRQVWYGRGRVVGGGSCSAGNSEVAP